MKAIALCVVVAFVFLGAEAAYGLGGGGQNGDGRADFLQKPDANGGSATNTNDQDTGGEQTDPPGDPQSPVGLPEPLAAILLGLGIIGLAGTKRKFKT